MKVYLGDSMEVHDLRALPGRLIPVFGSSYVPFERSILILALLSSMAGVFLMNIGLGAFASALGSFLMLGFLITVIENHAQPYSIDYSNWDMRETFVGAFSFVSFSFFFFYILCLISSEDHSTSSRIVFLILFFGFFIDSAVGTAIHGRSYFSRAGLISVTRSSILFAVSAFTVSIIDASSESIWSYQSPSDLFLSNSIGQLYFYVLIIVMLLVMIVYQPVINKIVKAIITDNDHVDAQFYPNAVMEKSFDISSSCLDKDVIIAHEAGHLAVASLVDHKQYDFCVGFYFAENKKRSTYNQSYAGVTYEYKESFLKNLAHLEWNMMLLIAGARSENLIFGAPHTGSGKDNQDWENLSTMFLEETAMQQGYIIEEKDLVDAEINRRVKLHLYNVQCEKVDLFLIHNRDVLDELISFLHEQVSSGHDCVVYKDLKVFLDRFEVPDDMVSLFPLQTVWGSNKNIVEVEHCEEVVY